MKYKYILWVIEAALWYLFIYLLLFSIQNIDSIDLINTSFGLLALAFLAVWACPWPRTLKGHGNAGCDGCGECGNCKKCKGCSNCNNGLCDSCGRHKLCGKCDKCETCRVS